MRVVESPSTFDGTVTYSTFVLVTVDIAASIRGVTDEAAIRAAEALPRAKCPAWIRMYTRRVGSPLFHVVFLLVGRGLPAPPLSFAAVPIAPNAAHPDTGRAAVEPSQPFPWPDCYIYTLRSLTAPISRLYEDPEHAIILDDEQTKPVLLACYRDANTEADLEHAASESGESDDDDLPPGVRIRDHDNYASILDGGSSSGSEGSSRGSAARKRPAARASTDDTASSRSSSSAAAALDTGAHISPEHEEKGIVLQLEVSGILNPSDEFGTPEGLLAVVRRLAEIEEERAERAVTARLAQAVAPKATAWLQGIPAPEELEDASGELRDGPLEPHPELDAIPGDPVSRSDEGAELQSDTSCKVPEQERISLDTSSALPCSPTARSPSPLPPRGTDGHMPVPPTPDDVRPPSPGQEARDGLEAGSREQPPEPATPDAACVPEGRPRSRDTPRDLEAGRLPPSTTSPSAKDGTPEHAGVPRGRTLGSLLSFLVSRLRALVSTFRALF